MPKRRHSGTNNTQKDTKKWRDNVKTVIELVQGFSEYLAEDGKRPKTIESYTGDVDGFLTYQQKSKEDLS